MKPDETLKTKIQLKDTTSIYSEDGNLVFQEGVILRKVSRFITGDTNDSIMPIPVFFDAKTGKVLKETLPKELHEEFGFNKEENATS